MRNYVPIETVDGEILVEVEPTEDSSGYKLASSGSRLPSMDSFEKACEKLKQDAQYVLEKMKDLQPDEVEISCGLKVGAETGVKPFWMLAKASGEASFSVTVKWNKADEKK